MFDQIKRLLKHSFIYALGSAIQSLVGFLLIPLYTRFLNPSDYGRLEICNTLLLMLTVILSLGLASALIKVHERDCQTEEEKKKMIGTVFLFLIPEVLIFLTLLYFFSPNLAFIFLKGKEFTSLIKLILITSIFAIFLSICFSTLRAKEKSKLYTTLYLLRFVFTLGLNIWFVVGLRLGVLGILLGNLIAQAGISLLFIPQVVKYTQLTFSKPLFKKLLAFGLPIVPASMAMWFMDLSDRHFLRFYSTMNEVGLYSLGYKIALAVSILLVWPFQLAWPTVFFSVAKRPDTKKIYAKVLTYFLFVACFLALILSIFGKQIIELMTTKKFFSAYKVIPLVSFAYVLYGVHYIVVPGLHLKEKTKYYPLLITIPALANIGLNFYFVPKYGMMGAAGTTLTCFVLMAIITYLLSNHFYPVKYERKRIFSLILAIFIAFGLFSAFHPKTLGLTISYNFLILAIFLGILYVIGFFRKEELFKIKQWILKIKHH